MTPTEEARIIALKQRNIETMAVRSIPCSMPVLQGVNLETRDEERGIKPRQSFRYVFGLISRPYRSIGTL
jgi:hypothetical protein